MPRAGVSTRARRRSAVPWWEELDSEAFREFSAARRERITERAPQSGSPTKADAAPVAADRPRPTVARRTAASPTARPNGTGHATTGRRTVTIRGQGAERNLPVARPTLRRHERAGFKPDRAALWAVMLGLVLILVAAASAHGAVLH